MERRKASRRCRDLRWPSRSGRALRRIPTRPKGSALSYSEAFTQLVQFVGYFLAIGSVGFRYGIVRRVRGMTEEAHGILRADNAAMLGVVGVLLLALSVLGGPYLQSVLEGKAFSAALPKN